VIVLFDINIPIVELFPIVMFFVAIFGLITSNNAIKSIIFMTVLNGATIAFWIAMGSRVGLIPPIMETDAHIYMAPYMSDPVPQALMITAIVIGFSVTAINIIMMNWLFRKYKTADWQTLFTLAKKEYKGKDGIAADDIPGLNEEDEF